MVYSLTTFVGGFLLTNLLMYTTKQVINALNVISYLQTSW